MMYETAPTGSLLDMSQIVSDETAEVPYDCDLRLPPGFDERAIDEMTLDHYTAAQPLRSEFGAFGSDGSLEFGARPNQTSHDFGSSSMGMPHGDRVYIQYRENSASGLKDDRANGKETTLDPESRIDLASFSGTMNTAFSDFQGAGSPGLHFSNKPGLYECLAQHREPEGNGILWLIMKTQEPEREHHRRQPRVVNCQTKTFKRYRLTLAQITAVSVGPTSGTLFERTGLDMFELSVEVPRRVLVRGKRDLEAERQSFYANFHSSLRANAALERSCEARGLNARERERLIQALIMCPVAVVPRITAVLAGDCSADGASAVSST